VSDTHSLVLAQSGAVYAFGSNTYYQCGTSENTAKSIGVSSSGIESSIRGAGRTANSYIVPSPTRVRQALSTKTIVHVSASNGGDGSYAIDSTGTAYRWGRLDASNADVSAKHNVMSAPTPVLQSIGAVTCVAAGERHAVFLTESGEAWAIGSAGPWLGSGPANVLSSYVHPVKVLLNADALVNGVGCGHRHTVLTTTNGKVIVCGEPSFGKLGLPSDVIGDASDINAVPVEVSLPGFEKNAQSACVKSFDLRGGEKEKMISRDEEAAEEKRWAEDVVVANGVAASSAARQNAGKDDSIFSKYRTASVGVGVGVVDGAWWPARMSRTLADTIGFALPNSNSPGKNGGNAVGNRVRSASAPVVGERRTDEDERRGDCFQGFVGRGKRRIKVACGMNHTVVVVKEVDEDEEVG
jgi:alpha-tubulin suppressor-like RCC1 family protein